MVNLLTPLITAVLLPAAIAVALLPVSWQLGRGRAWAACRCCWARCGRRRDWRVAPMHAAADANTALTERIIEFARTQQALRAARRVEPASSLVGDALAAQHGATMRLLAMQIPGQLLFSLASQLALILLAGATTALTVHGHARRVAEAIALIVVIARYLEPFTTDQRAGAGAGEHPRHPRPHPLGARPHRSWRPEPQRWRGRRRRAAASSSTTSRSATTAPARRCWTA